jgi:hypothetical protein
LTITIDFNFAFIKCKSLKIQNKNIIKWVID